MTLYFKGHDEKKEKQEIGDLYIREMVYDVFDVVLVHNGMLTSIQSIALDFKFDVPGVLDCLFTKISLEIESHKIVVIRSDFEHLDPLRLIVPFYCT